jgi:hypothetical protein
VCARADQEYKKNTTHNFFLELFGLFLPLIPEQAERGNCRYASSGDVRWMRCSTPFEGEESRMMTLYMVDTRIFSSQTRVL